MTFKSEIKYVYFRIYLVPFPPSFMTQASRRLHHVQLSFIHLRESRIAQVQYIRHTYSSKFDTTGRATVEALVDGFSPQTRGFSPKIFHVGSVVSKVEVRQLCSPSTYAFSCSSCHSTNAVYISTHLSSV